MRRTLTPKTNLDTLRKDAKRWLKAIRAGDADAIAQLRESGAKPSADPGLRDVHQALDPADIDRRQLAQGIVDAHDTAGNS